jgi:uncharacterized protein YggU (UPF0235/DUF167 family)
VSALEWLLVIELIILAVMAIMGAVGMFIAKNDPDDPISVFCATFWREFLWPPAVLPIDSPRLVARPPSPRTSKRAAPGPVEEASEEDAFYGRVRKGQDGKKLTSTLDILVEPNAASDQVVGRDEGGIRLRVTGEAGESRSNKALIELVASAIGVKPYQVTLTKGHYQSHKTVQVQGLSPDELQDKLASLPEVE